MKNAFRVLKRDYLRLLKAPAALVVVFVLVVLPSLYTWFNVVGFWDPYGNTGNIRVCVVNEDEGATIESMGELNMGDQVIDQLRENNQLGWTFTDRETAMEEVNSGKAYAAFIMPSDFSYDVTTLLTGDFTQPQLEYYVNEKAGGVSTKVTDTGAYTLDETINSTFVSTVSGVVASTLNSGISNAEEDIDAGQTSVAAQLDKASSSLQEARDSVTDLKSASDDLSAKTTDAKEKLQSAKDGIQGLSDQLQEASSLLTSTQNAVGPLVSRMDSVLDESNELARSACNNANTAVNTVNSQVQAAEGAVAVVSQASDTIISSNTMMIQVLKTLQDTPGLDDNAKKALEEAIASLEQQNSSLEQTVQDLNTAYSHLSTASDDINTAAGKMNDALQNTLAVSKDYRNTFNSQTLPVLNDGITKLSNALAGLSTAVSNQQLLIDQSVIALDQLNSALATTADALGQTDGLLEGFQSDIDTVKTDVLALGTSSALEELFGGQIDADKIASFMLSPTQLETVELYSVNSYGSAMAPLFMNMTLWIGVFMLLVILRQEVDDEGIRNLSSRQRYLGKWLFLAPLVVMQAVVCCAGNLFLGVEVASVPLFFITAMFTSLTYLSIQFALSVLFQHVGKGMCIILIFVQIPGATGLYPIEMTPPFFQTVYPMFPFTYGINALRETIAGFYGLQWVGFMAVLLLFFLIFFIGGFLARPYLTNMNRMFSRQIASSDIFNGEESELPARRYRLDQLFRVLADRGEYRARLMASAKKFIHWYPRLRRYALILALAVPAVVSPILGLLGLEKVVILTCWLAWFAVTVFFLIGLEFIRDRMAHDIALDDLSDEELSMLFQARDGVSASPAPAPVDLRREVRK